MIEPKIMENMTNEIPKINKKKINKQSNMSNK